MRIRSAVKGRLQGLDRRSRELPSGRRDRRCVFDVVSLVDRRNLLTGDIRVFTSGCLPKALREIKTADLHGSDIFGDWKEFMELAKERLAAFKAFDSPTYISCDNVKCGLIDERNKFNVCSACRRQYYYSAECQRTDWGEGKHREECEVISRVFVEEPEDLGKREQAFLRALLHHDYQRKKLGIWSYPCRNTAIAETPFRIARAMASGGRLELHPVRIAQGHAARGRWIPQRSRSSAVGEGLRRIAHGIELGVDIPDVREQVLADMRQLSEETAGIIQIHQRRIPQSSRGISARERH
ncbi:hypothetical protein B0H17DRAFT_1138522 [Mycena rosella]|uniref:MYND-type domain-containing protein n=1 Tax=Mycena rosella TaxID=1033263 RepID=A0AAD7D690_MYCRO|nr:hypothetical protein B0H17DRAFT_1138522 [Mycena rosella]